MADISKIKLPNGSTYDIKATALTSKSVGSNTKPVYFDASGKPVASTGNVGGYNNPICMVGGNLEQVTGVNGNLIAGYIGRRTVLDTHGEGGGVLIPFAENDMAFLTQRGGSYTVKKADGTVLNTNLNDCWDGTGGYTSVGWDANNATIIEITLPFSAYYAQYFYISFGDSSWRAKSVKVDVMHSTYDTDWTTRYEVTNSNLGIHYFSVQYKTKKPDGTDFWAFNKIRITLNNWNNPNDRRIAGIGLKGCNSAGIASTMLTRSGGTIYGGLTVNGETISKNPNGFRIACGDYGTIFRNDGAGTYLLVTEKGKAVSGSWTSARPLYIENATGVCNINGKAAALSSNAGSVNQPIYFKDGKPVATSYALNKTVPSDAKFTDTTYSVATQSANGLMSAADKKKVDNSVNIPFITGTQTAATGSWIGTASTISALTDGLTINYWLPYNGSGNATLNLTLADGTKTGAVNCYYGGTTRLTTHYSAGSVIQMTYRKDVTIAGSSTKYTGWWAKANYNNDTYDRERHTGNIVAGSAIVAGNIIVGLDGKYSHLKTGGSFMTTYPILCAGSAIAANATGNNNYQSVNVDVRTTQNITLTAYKPVYIKGNIVGRLFTPASTAPLTQTVPTTADNYEYMRLGLAYSTTSFKLEQVHPIYKYIPGPGFIEYTQALQVSGGTIKGSLSRDNVPNTAWVNGRSNATFRNTIGPTSDSIYLPLTSAKSQTGSWDVGVYGDSFIIAYVKDADFNTQTNSATIFNFYKSGMQVPKIRANNFALGTEDTAGFHNSLFRGKFLGYSVSSEQWSQITAGTFDDMFIGDFWLINDRAIRILAFDWYYNIGNPKLTKHHIVVAPDLPLGSGKMNNSNVVTGGYYGSLMKQSGLNSSLATLVSMFGDSHVLTRKALLTNSVNGNTPNGSAWYDTRIDLMNETQVFGCIAYEVHSGFANGVDYNQFPMFRLDQKYISANGDWWLRSIASANGFSYVSVGGDPYTGASSDTRFIRPYILIG